jgi:hypothetical protein
LLARALGMLLCFVCTLKTTGSSQVGCAYGLTRNVWASVGLTLNGAGGKQVVRNVILSLLPFDNTIQHVCSALFISLFVNGDDESILQ